MPTTTEKKSGQLHHHRNNFLNGNNQKRISPEPKIVVSGVSKEGVKFQLGLDEDEEINLEVENINNNQRTAMKNELMFGQAPGGAFRRSSTSTNYSTRESSPATEAMNTASSGPPKAAVVFFATAKTSPRSPTKHASPTASAPTMPRMIRATRISPASVAGLSPGNSRSRKSTTIAVVTE